MTPAQAASLVLSCMLAAVWPVSASTQRSAPASGATAPVRGTTAAGEQPEQSLQDAVASVVVVALTDQFDGRTISVEIDDYNVAIASARERLVTGRGRVELGGQGKNAVSFTYRALYDVVDAHAGYPAITVNGVAGGGERLVPNDARLIGQLDDRVADALSGELGGKQVWLQLDRIESYESGGRYVRINASGLADFGVDGSTPAQVEALYDLHDDVWLRVNYVLGAAGKVSMAGLQAAR